MSFRRRLKYSWTIYVQYLFKSVLMIQLWTLLVRSDLLLLIADRNEF